MKHNKLKIVFMGTPGCACPFLEYLEKNYDVVLVCTAPDKRRGRNMEIGASSVKEKALSLGLNILQPKDLEDKEIARAIKDVNPDALVVIAYGYKLTKNILDIPRYGSINIHFSLLPKYRGAAPAAWAIANGETKSGVTGFILNEKIDAGGILCQEEVAIEDSDTQETLMAKLVVKGLQILPKTLDKLVSKEAGKKQEESTGMYARKLQKEDGLIKWDLSNVEIYNKMRAFTPWPGAYTYLNGETLKLFSASCDKNKEKGTKPGTIIDITSERGMQVQCGTGTIWIKDVQAQGKRRMSIYELSVGRKLKIGDIFENKV